MLVAILNTRLPTGVAIPGDGRAQPGVRGPPPRGCARGSRGALVVVFEPEVIAHVRYQNRNDPHAGGAGTSARAGASCPTSRAQERMTGTARGPSRPACNSGLRCIGVPGHGHPGMVPRQAHRGKSKVGTQPRKVVRHTSQPTTRRRGGPRASAERPGPPAGRNRPASGRYRRIRVEPRPAKSGWQPERSRQVAFQPWSPSGGWPRVVTRLPPERSRCVACQAAGTGPLASVHDGTPGVPPETARSGSG